MKNITEKIKCREEQQSAPKEDSSGN